MEYIIKHIKLRVGLFSVYLERIGNVELYFTLFAGSAYNATYCTVYMLIGAGKLYR